MSGRDIGEGESALPIFGDMVRWSLHAGTAEEGYVIGFCAFGAKRTPNPYAVVATEEGLGMSIHIGHLSVLSRGHDEICRRYRERYMASDHNELISIEGEL